MKTTFCLLVVFILAGIISCKKDKKEPAADSQSTPAPAPTNTDNYSSLNDFYSKNGVKKQIFTINAASGGSFVTPQGTTIQVPAGCFAGNSNVTIEFKDIYTKSDMLLSNMGTRMLSGAPLLSGGEFFIKAISNGTVVQITNSLSISIKQPKNPNDTTSMQAFTAAKDTSSNYGWWNDPNASVLNNTSNYVFSLYQFNPPLDSGTWSNSDSPLYFNSYPQTNLTIHPTQTGYLMDVFLVLKNVRTMVHIYKDYSTGNFPYGYAPLGHEATVVAIGVKDGKLYSSFTPITIGSNQTVNFTLSETTTDSFKAALKSLD
jgi:hypothetical protein